jgi:hypothetical protein
VGRKPNNLQNLASERRGLTFLLQEDLGLVIPSREQKRRLLLILNLPTKLSRSFDLVQLKVPTVEQVTSKDDFILIEVKVTEKELPDFPKGFFFGMTKNEEDLMRNLGNSFRLCLLSIHPRSQKYILLDYFDLESRIKTKRIQYQINL